MPKNRKIILIVFIIIVLVIAGLYVTYAVGVLGVQSSINSYNMTLTDNNNNITLAANENKEVLYKVKNISRGKVRYGIGYTNSTNVSVTAMNNNIDEPTGLIEQNDYKYVKLKITNNTNSQQTTTISTVLGYENGGNLILPSGVTLVTTSTDVSSTKFISKIYSKTGTVTEGNGTVNDVDVTHNIIKDLRGNMRYYGQDPNNYIYFNCSDYSNLSSSTCETWRIIGMVDGKLKLMRSSKIGNYSWDTSVSTINEGRGINEWSQADLMKLLNPGYENNTDLNDSGTSIIVNNSLYYNSNSGNCYNGQNSVTTQCDFSSTGIKNSDTRNMISTSTYYLGGGASSNIYPSEALIMERGTEVKQNPPDGMTRTTSWQGKIAVPYPSDYGYATDLFSCSVQIDSYNSDNNSYACRGNNWMWYNLNDATTATSDDGVSSAWLLSPSTSYYRNAWRVNKSGDVAYNYYTNNTSNVTPVLYLNADVFIDINHTGSISNPYTIVIK